MDFTAILEYQKIEGIIEQLKDKFQRSPAYRSYSVALKAYSDLAAEYKDLQNKFIEYNQNYQKTIAEYNIVSKTLDEAMVKAKVADNLSDVTSYLDKLNAISERLEWLETTSEKLIDQIAKTRKNYDEVHKEGGVKQAAKNDAKKVYDKEKEQLDANIATCNAALKQIEGKMAPEAMGMYNKVKSANVKYPYVVKQTKDKEYCDGCAKYIGTAVYSLVKEGDYIECPECGRILFL